MADESETVDLVRRAYAATVATGTARILAVTEHDFAQWGEDLRRNRAQPRPAQFVANVVAGLLRPLGSVAKSAGTRLWRVVGRGVSFRRQEAEGVIDFAHRRYAVDYGYYSVMYVDGQHWSGRSGRARQTLPARDHKCRLRCGSSTCCAASRRRRTKDRTPSATSRASVAQHVWTSAAHRQPRLTVWPPPLAVGSTNCSRFPWTCGSTARTLGECAMSPMGQPRPSNSGTSVSGSRP